MPEPWPQATLGDLATWFSGGTPKAGSPEYYNGGTIPWATIGDIQDQPILETATQLTDAGAAVAGRLAPVGAVLVSMYGTIGRTGLAAVPMATNQAIAWGIPDDERCSGKFLFLLVQALRERLDSLGRGATQRNINRAILREQPVPVPPLPEQRRIVDLIGALDAQIAALTSECDSLGMLVVAVREALVAGVKWEPVGTMVEPKGVQIGPFGSQLHAHEYAASGVPVVMPQDLHGGEIRTSKIKYIPEATAATLARHRLRPGDLILPRRGDLTKRALVTREQTGWLCGTGCIRIRLADPALAPALLEGLSNARTDEWLMTNAVGTTMLNLNTEIVSKLPAPRFSDSERSLAESCISTQALLKAVRAENESLSAVRQRVLSALLSAEIEIPNSYDALLSEAV